MSQGSFNPKIRFLGQKVCSVARLHTHTHTKVTTVGTLSGFQEFFLQPIIKDRPKTCLGGFTYGPVLTFKTVYYKKDLFIWTSVS